MVRGKIKPSFDRKIFATLLDQQLISDYKSLPSSINTKLVESQDPDDDSFNQQTANETE